ncbi:MAG: hypothetical protein HUU35_15665 [Armatimonadetes bacterium]|nr:hypothetical protein [Armatimonadota bacterium]
MEAILRLDRRLVLALSRGLRELQKQVTWPVHTAAFWAAAGLYLVVWVLLCLTQDQIDWVWYLFVSAPGVIAAYLTDNEPIEPLEEGIALTHQGVEPRWGLLRMMYGAAALLVLLPRIFGSGLPPQALALFVIELALFVLMEYLLTFRLISADHPLLKMREQLEALFRAHGDNPAAVDGGEG